MKDRAALAMIDRRGASRLLRAGRYGRRSVAGNTGVGLAVVCAVRGYRCVIVLPETTSTDKRGVLRAFGAEIVLARADVEPSSPRGTSAKRGSLAEELGAFNPDQFENPANPGAHYAQTGPEILDDCGGAIDAFVACVGSGGTLGGTRDFLRERPRRRHRRRGARSRPLRGRTAARWSRGSSRTSSRAQAKGLAPDEIVRVPDRDAVAMTLRLAREEAILAGGSAGVAVYAAVEVAAELGPRQACRDDHARYGAQLPFDVLQHERGARAAVS